jgi:(2Fe-2S) ferredoxin
LNKPKHHIFICTSSRADGKQKGKCSKKDSPELIEYLEEGLTERGMDEVQVSNTGCLKRCDDAPVMVIYPEGYWYGDLEESLIDTILDALEQGKPAENLLLD